MSEFKFNNGNTLLEIILAIVVMAFFLLAINNSFYSVNSFNYSSTQNNYAVELSQQIIEIIQGEDIDLMSVLGKNDFEDFSIFTGAITDTLIKRFDDISIEIRKFSWNDTIFAGIYQINIEVIWTDKGETHSDNLSTLIYKR